jgi:putative PIN family toxin of toxin-antitoxin system
MLIVLDTNVLVSGVLNPSGAPGRLVDLILAYRVAVAYDDRLLAEYSRVLARPRFHIQPEEIHNLLGVWRYAGRLVTGSPLKIESAPDPDDLPFAEVAVAAQADALVTGNPKHFAFLPKLGVPVLSPAECLKRLA